MKKLIITTLLGLSLFAFVGCTEDAKETQKTQSTMKCEAGKCGTAMDKKEAPAKKCSADTKCGEGKCGSK